MYISECIKVARTASKSYRQVVCEFCGAETLSGGGITFCSSCESAVGSEAKRLESAAPELFSSLNSIRTSVQNGDYEGAAAVYDGLLKDKPSPQLLYAKGIMYIEYSNYVVSQIRYGGDGFMERNSELRAKGSLLISEAKRLITKSLSISEKETKEAPNLHAFYLMFLCNLKMGNLRGASNHAAMIEKLDKDGIIAAYARVVLDTNTEMYKEAEHFIGKALRMKDPPTNLLYYAAFNAFKLGDSNGAMQIIKSADGLIEDVKKAGILAAINEKENAAQ